MPVYNKITDDDSVAPNERVRLDERFITLFLDESPEDRVEAQELRQLVSRALQTLTKEEMAVIEQRYQYKRSPGQVASKLGISRDEMKRLETSGLKKLQTPLQAYMES